MANEQDQLPIIDSHVLFYDPRNAVPSGEGYSRITRDESNIEGYILVEASHEGSLYNIEDEASLEEYIGADFPMPSLKYGIRKSHKGRRDAQKPCVALLPWAPLSLGREAMKKWRVRSMDAAETESRHGISGFHYFFAKKARGTAVKAPFIDALKWMGEEDLVLDLSIDQKGAGRWQLEEAIEMIGMAHEGVVEAQKVTVIINHICRPDLSIYNQTDPSFVAWRTTIFTLSKCSKTYIKLAGCLSQLPPRVRTTSVDDIVSALQPYLVVLLASFGAPRIMFGSDWPYCAEAVDDGWEKWKRVVARFCDLASLSREDQIMLWSGTAIGAYGISSLL